VALLGIFLDAPSGAAPHHHVVSSAPVAARPMFFRAEHRLHLSHAGSIHIHSLSVAIGTGYDPEHEEPTQCR